MINTYYCENVEIKKRYITEEHFMPTK